MNRIDREPLVAILTPVYNGARFLRETMECVQASDYGNLVHIVLDNASTDATPDIIESFQGRRVPIVVHRNPKTVPMIDNHNAAVALCPKEAKYFRNLCADDLMAPAAIRRQVEIAERFPEVTVVGCQCRATGLCGSELPRGRTVFAADEIVRWYLRRETAAISGTQALIRASAIDFSRPFYDARLLDRWDTDANLRLVMHGAFGFVHEELAFFRMHDSGHTSLVALPEGTHDFDWLMLLDRYGPLVMTPKEYKHCRNLYRRHLLRRLLLMRWRHGDRRLFDLQMRRLAEISDAPGFAGFLGALLEWLYFAATGQRHRVGSPRAAAGSLAAGKARHHERDASGILTTSPFPAMPGKSSSASE